MFVLRNSMAPFRSFPSFISPADLYIRRLQTDMLSVDPWFNFRATKYLVQNGFYNFWDWFDDRKLHRP